MKELNDNDLLWEQFARLGERIGDGDLGSSERWVTAEYKRLSKILVPEIKEAYDKKRIAKSNHVNEQMAKLISWKLCQCGGSLRQSRSGSIICYCKVCNKRFQAVKSK